MPDMGAHFVPSLKVNTSALIDTLTNILKKVKHDNSFYVMQVVHINLTLHAFNCMKWRDKTKFHVAHFASHSA